jgi:hypothetical protein
MPQVLIIYAALVPLALLMGYLLATPLGISSFGLMMIIFGILISPILLRHHHALVVFTWNATLIIFFLPGQPAFGTAAAVLSLSISIIEQTMNKNRRVLWVPSVGWPLLALTAVVLITAELTGGIGGRVFGSETWGARRYFGVFGAVIGYFALTAHRIPTRKGALYVSIFFLAGLTSMISDLAYMGGSQFDFLYALFPSDYAGMQALTADTLVRYGGLAFACAGGFYFLIARHGICGLFSPRRFLSLLLLLGFASGTLLGGYRGLVILLLLVFLAQFAIEQVYRTALGPVILFSCLLVVGVMTTNIERMPLSVQRAFSFLPLEGISPMARSDAIGTLDWRLTMWKMLLPEIPNYILVGKGYSFNGTDYYLTQEAMRRGMYFGPEDTLISGNYHNGILTLLIPFGIFGFGAFLLFSATSCRVLYNNMRYGDPALSRANTFLLAYFVARWLFYMIFYGQFDSDLMHFTGIIGLSIALNGGVRSPEPAVERQVLALPEPVPA